jgi:hypothetical protein
MAAVKKADGNKEGEKPDVPTLLVGMSNLEAPSKNSGALPQKVRHESLCGPAIPLLGETQGRQKHEAREPEPSALSS